MKRLLSLSLLLLLSACDPDPKVTVDSPLQQAEALIAKRDYPGAITVLENERRVNGEVPAVVKRLVDLYRVQGDEARAIQRARAGLEAHPDANELYLPLANLYFSIKQLDQVKPLLVEARRRGIEEAGVSLLMGACLAQQEDTAGARTEFERARAAGADEKLVAMNLGLLLIQEGKSDQALAAFEALSAKHPEMAGPKREIARLLLAQATLKGQAGEPLDRALVDRAMNLLWDVKDELKSDWRMHEAMGDGWLLLGDFDASLLAYTEALKFGRNPKSVEDRYRMAKKMQNESKQAVSKAEDSPK